MWSRLVLGFLFVLQSNSVSPLTNDTQITVTNGVTGPCSCKVYDRKSDLLRQLLNQETIIRMAIEIKVRNIVKGMEKLKERMESNDETFREEIIALKYRNQQIKKSTKRQQEEAKRDIVALRKKTEKSETKTNNQLQDAKGEISAFKKEIQSLEGNLKNQSNMTNISVSELNAAIDAMKANVDQTKKTQLKLSSAVSTLEVFQNHFSLLTKYDGLNTTIVAIKADLKQTKKAQLKLSSAVSTLEVFRNNMSLLTKYVKETRVGFTVAVTSSSSSWQGDILVFPHVVTNTGNSYNTGTGKFTAPRAGTYVFFVTGVSWSTYNLSLSIVHNGANKVRTWSTNAPYQTGTNLAVLELRQGDTVWVRRHYGTGYYTDSVPITTFSGFLL